MPGHVPPQGARREAEIGLEWRREFRRGGTKVGVARARDLMNGRQLSDSTIRRMVSYFARHEVDKRGRGWRRGEPGFPSAGRIAWALWGGDAGRAWANKIYARIMRENPPPEDEDGDVEEDQSELHSELVRELGGIAAESRSSLAARSLGSITGGGMRDVGYSNAQGYIEALRRGVSAETEANFLRVLRDSYGFTDEQIASLEIGPRIIVRSDEPQPSPAEIAQPKQAAVDVAAMVDSSKKIRAQIEPLIEESRNLQNEFYDFKESVTTAEGADERRVRSLRMRADDLNQRIKNVLSESNKISNDLDYKRIRSNTPEEDRNLASKELGILKNLRFDLRIQARQLDEADNDLLAKIRKFVRFFGMTDGEVRNELRSQIFNSEDIASEDLSLIREYQMGAQRLLDIAISKIGISGKLADDLTSASEKLDDLYEEANGYNEYIKMVARSDHERKLRPALEKILKSQRKISNDIASLYRKAYDVFRHEFYPLYKKADKRATGVIPSSEEVEPNKESAYVSALGTQLTTETAEIYEDALRHFYGWSEKDISEIEKGPRITVAEDENLLSVSARLPENIAKHIKESAEQATSLGYQSNLRRQLEGDFWDFYHKEILDMASQPSREYLLKRKKEKDLLYKISEMLAVCAGELNRLFKTPLEVMPTVVDDYGHLSSDHGLTAAKEIKSLSIDYAKSIESTESVEKKGVISGSRAQALALAKSAYNFGVAAELIFSSIDSNKSEDEILRLSDKSREYSDLSKFSFDEYRWFSHNYEYWEDGFMRAISGSSPNREPDSSASTAIPAESGSVRPIEGYEEERQQKLTAMGRGPDEYAEIFRKEIPTGTRVVFNSPDVGPSPVFKKGYSGTVVYNRHNGVVVLLDERYRGDDLNSHYVIFGNTDSKGYNLLYRNAIKESLCDSHDADYVGKICGTSWSLASLHYIIRKMSDAEMRYSMLEMNPSELVENPPWITAILANDYEWMEDNMPAELLPRLTVTPTRRKKLKKLTAELPEYGCGSYGCVLPTMNRDFVIKVTSDESEVEFASNMLDKLSANITCDYIAVAPSESVDREGAPVYYLWREAAEFPGKLDEYLEAFGEDPSEAFYFVKRQHDAAQLALDLLWENKNAVAELENWAVTVKEMGERVGELSELAKGLLTILKNDRVFFGDVHFGNIGQVNGRWVIIDPGNIVKLTGNTNIRVP